MRFLSLKNISSQTDSDKNDRYSKGKSNHFLHPEYIPSDSSQKESPEN